MLYFIRAGNYIKIGLSNSPWRRLADLQTASPDPLEMLCICPGDNMFENELHKLFSEHHHNNEWFHDAPRLNEYIQFMRRLFPALQERPQVPGLEPSIEQDSNRGEGWIEYCRRGTKNPKRYAYYRQWVRDDKAGWKKSPLKRVQSIRPMTEEEYQEYMSNGIFPAGVTIEA